MHEQASGAPAAVILAAGKGTRLGALTAHHPKPMIRIAGHPVLEHIIERMRSADIADLIVVIGYLGEQISAYFGDGSNCNVRIRYVEQGEAHGTGAAVLAARPLIDAKPFVMCFADIITESEHYRKVLSAYSAGGCAAVVGINPMADASSGAAVHRQGDRIVKIVEKPASPAERTGWNQAGVSVFGAEVWNVLAALPPSARGEIEITDAVEALIERGLTVRACELTGGWFDIGTEAALREAERAIQQGQV